MTILNLSLNLSIIILLTVIFRAVFFQKVPIHTFRILWIVCIFRALIPLSIGSRFSILSALSYLINNKNTSNIGFENNGDLGFFLIDSSVSGNATTPTLAILDKTWKLIDIFQIIWLIGFITIFLHILVNHIKCSRCYACAVPLNSAYVKKWQENHPLKRDYKILYSDQILVPLTYKIIHPVILLPKKLAPSQDKNISYILKHEFVHIKHWDIVYKMILTLVLCLHWFNPIAWLMFFFATQDIEHHCDDALLKMSSPKAKKEYAFALVSLESERTKLLSMTNTFSTTSTESRIKYIMRKQNCSKLTFLSALLIFVGIIILSSGESSAAPPVNNAYDIQELARLEDNFNIPSATYDNYITVLDLLKIDDYQGLSLASFRDFVANAFLNNPELVDAYDRIRYDFAVNGKFDINLSEGDYNFLLCTLPATIREYSDESRHSDDPFTLRLVEDIQNPFIRIDYSVIYKVDNEDDFSVYERDMILLNIISSMRNIASQMSTNEIDNFDQKQLNNASINLALQYTNEQMHVQIENPGWISLETP